MTHDLSLGEVHSLALKAARGSGRSFGLAEEAAFAVRWLVERGYDGAGHLAVLLRGDGPCPIAFGCALSDAGVVPDERQKAVLCPVMLAPFLEGICPEGHGLILSWGEECLRIGSDGAVDGPCPPAAALSVDLHTGTAPAARQFHNRGCLSDDTLAILTAFAARTYAPATEESRARGAGAGLSDND